MLVWKGAVQLKLGFVPSSSSTSSSSPLRHPYPCTGFSRPSLPLLPSDILTFQILTRSTRNAGGQPAAAIHFQLGIWAAKLGLGLVLGFGQGKKMKTKCKGGEEKIPPKLLRPGGL